MIENILKKFGYSKQPQKRSYAAAQAGRLFSSWNTHSQTADKEISNNLSTMRARSRDLVRNNDYAKKYIRMVKTNVIGHGGIGLQVRSKDPKGTLDRTANTIIENAWWQWGKKGNCDVTGKHSWRDFQNLFIQSIAQDGEVLVRKIFDKKTGLKLQLIEADHLDEKYNDEIKRISMGIEYDAWGKPIAYHVFTKHPSGTNIAGIERERIPAEEIIHGYRPDRVSQGRGVPWMHSAMTRIKMLDGYEEAELTAARVAASKMGFYTSPAGEQYTGDDKDAAGNPITDAEPGVFEVLPEGWGFQAYDPQHPTSAFKDFEKAILRGIASGLDVSYNYLANDLEGVSYSSIRAGVLDERDMWRDVQSWVVETLCDDVFTDWLRNSILVGYINLPMNKFDKFNAPIWNPRGWAWVDPLKDIRASIEAINAGLKTASQVAMEQGMDIEEIYEQLSLEQKLRDDYGIKTDFTLQQEAINGSEN
jgi:lambda family phage portal protein